MCFYYCDQLWLDSRRKIGWNKRDGKTEIIEESILPTQIYTGKKGEGDEPLFFPFHSNLILSLHTKDNLLPTRQKPFVNIQQILFIADFPADSCEKGTMKINESR